MKVTGRCHCGQISFEAEVDPATVRVCHCTDCQTLTGTAFRTNVASLPGTPLYSAAPGPNPSSVGLRVGTLDRRAELRPARQGWCRSALPWSMDLTGVERFERQ
jgi:hypothetical protein